MGFFAIGNSFRKKLFGAFTLSILIATSCQMVLAVGPNDATLEKLEKWLFFATFPDESDESRVKRLEERTFGDAAEGDVNQRLKKLDEILTERQKEKEGQDQPAAGKTPVPPAGQSGGNGTAGDADQSKKPVVDKQSEADAAKERQRIAVQAAREQEMADLLEEGAKLWRNRHGEEAVDRFLQVLRLDPHNPTAHFSIGVVQESQGKLKEAQAHYQAASQAEPDNRDYSDAVIAVGNKIKQADNDPNKVLNEQAATAFKRGEYISAINLYKELESKNPKQAIVKYSLGTTYLMMKDYFNAMEYFKLAVQLEPNNPKYLKAYNELNAEMAKHQQDQQGVEQQYAGMTSEGALSPSVPAGVATTGVATGAAAGAAKGKASKGGKKAAAEVSAAGTQNGVKIPAGQSLKPVQQAQYQPQQPPQQMPGQYQQAPQQFSQYPAQQPQYQPRMQNQQFPQQHQGQYQGAAPMQQNPYNQAAYQNAMSQSSSGSYIPPDPQQYSYHAAKQPLQSQQMPMQQQQQMPMQQQQMPMQQQQMPMQQSGYGQQQMPTQQQQMPMQQSGYGQQQMPMQQSGYGQQYQSQNQYGTQGGMQSSGGSDYTPPPQAAPQGAFDPRLAQRLNNPTPAQQAPSSSADPMGNYGLSGKGSQEGVLVSNVRSGSRAARAGLKKGDLIRTVDGNEVTQTSQLNQVLSQYDGSQTLPLLIFRDGILTPIQF